MKRLAIYAHYDASPTIAAHVPFCLSSLAGLGFQICFVSNSEIPEASAHALKKICHRVIVRENSGFDFGMWQRGLTEYDLAHFEELLITNSSVIGPVQPLAPFWQHPATTDCDFWGLTDNCRFAPHLQSYFLVFRKRVIHDWRFGEFWRSVLPYVDKLQVVLSYEVGLTRWLEEGGFKWRAIFPQEHIWAEALKQRSFARKIYHFCSRRELPALDTTLYAPKALLQWGMPFLKVHLLRENWLEISPKTSLSYLENIHLPADVLEELRAGVRQRMNK